MPQSKAANSAAEGFTGKILRAPAKKSPKPSHDDVDCPAATLAHEAAEALRLRRRLSDHHKSFDSEMIKALERADDVVGAGEMRDLLYDRFYAILNFVPHTRARSLKGALFQLYAAAGEAQCPQGKITTHLSSEDRAALDEGGKKVTRLHLSALSYLERYGFDDDLELIRDWLFASKYDVHSACELFAEDRSALLSQIRSTAASERATRNRARAN